MNNLDVTELIFQGEQIAKVRCTEVPIRLFFLLSGLIECQRLYWPENKGFR